MRRRISAVVLLFLLGLPSWAGSQVSTVKQINPASHAKLDISAVTQLLDVLELLMRKNPDYESTLDTLRTLPESDALEELFLLGDKNAADPEISAAIDKLLNSPTYQLYYRQFHNVTPEIHRQVLCALPYTAVNSPGDIASSLRELCLNMEPVRTWVTNVIFRIDLNRSHQIALQWLPPGQYVPPVIHFFYDGNADAFALDNDVGFDLYGSILSRRPPETRFANMGDLGVDRIELILAHELHHVYSGRYLYPPGRKYADWRDQWKDRLIRQIVSEGVAMQCDVRPSFRRTLMEDSIIVRYWIGQLNGTLAALRTDSVTEAQVQAWLENSYHPTAVRLLDDYRKRTAPDEDSAAYMRQHIFDRPPMVYTLGWWMVGRITEGGKKREAAIRLLSDAPSLYKSYNESLPEGESTLRVKF